MTYSESTAKVAITVDTVKKLVGRGTGVDSLGLTGIPSINGNLPTDPTDLSQDTVAPGAVYVSEQFAALGTATTATNFNVKFYQNDTQTEITATDIGNGDAYVKKGDKVIIELTAKAAITVDGLKAMTGTAKSAEFDIAADAALVCSCDAGAVASATTTKVTFKQADATAGVRVTDTITGTWTVPASAFADGTESWTMPVLTDTTGA